MKIGLQISTIGLIVNHKREAEGKLPIGDRGFFRRHIQRKLDYKSEVSFKDPREVLRLVWLTYEQQKKHYVNWEFHLIKSGFGREPENKKERNMYGNVIFHPGQLDRILHIDEMGFSFDGAKNGIGGRIPCYYSNPLIAEAGTDREKSSSESCRALKHTFPVLRFFLRSF